MCPTYEGASHRLHFQINVLDVNDEPPRFKPPWPNYPDAQAKAVLVNEISTPPGTRVFSAEATDADATADLVYSWSPGREVDTEGRFYISPTAIKFHVFVPVTAHPKNVSAHLVICEFIAPFQGRQKVQREAPFNGRHTILPFPRLHSACTARDYFGTCACVTVSITKPPKVPARSVAL
ncbi:unnamed protein product [Dibothriocephalus latus]|uniref:Cadherin domain-containing protein n=1 Tax=Dibothriocephalus latus TaxID=60516 RepID=A0A3P6PJ16_DIBLA|nr:unnamed protein product [Dibothriocephalus latus]